MRKLSDVDTIKGVIELLKDPKSWIKWYKARDRQGYYVSPTDESAVSWCLGGAVMKVLGDTEYEWSWSDSPLAETLNAISLRRGCDGFGIPFVDFNNADETSHQDLMSFLTEALEVSEEESRV